MSHGLLRIVFCAAFTLAELSTIAIDAGCASVSASSPAADKKQALKPYALIFGTVYGPDQHPEAGVTVKIPARL